MQKEAKIVLGTLLIISGVSLILSQFIGITGFIVGDSPARFIPPILGIFIFTSGILILLSRDVLQARLEEKEKESPSPSLQGKKPTLREKLHFGMRRLFKSRIKKVPQKEAQYQDQSVLERLYNSPELERRYAQQKEMQKKAEKELPKLRKKVYQSSKEMEEAVAGRRYSHGAEEIPLWQRDVKEMHETSKKAGMELPVHLYVKHFQKKAKPGFEKTAKRTEELLKENKQALYEDELSSQLQKHGRWARAAGEKPISREEAEKIYLEESKTVSVEEASKKYNVKFIHALPFGKTQNMIHVVYNNPYWGKRQYEARERMLGLNDKSFLDFLKEVKELKPALSSSTIGQTESGRSFFSPVGIILKKGKIYDAGSQDIASRPSAENPKLRLRNWGGNQELPLEERVSAAIRQKGRYGGSKHNEFVVGDYEIEGLYFVKMPEAWGNAKEPYDKEVVKKMAEYSVREKTPLFEYEQGKGFTQVNPSDYLHLRHEEPQISESYSSQLKSREKKLPGPKKPTATRRKRAKS